MPIHVLQLGPYPPPEGGVTRNILAIRDRLRERGDRCSVIATSRSSKAADEPDVFHPRSAAALVSLIRNTPHDVLHLHIGGDITKRVLGLCLGAAAFGKHPVLTVHSGGYASSAEARDAGPGSARARIFRRFSQVVVVNKELENVFIRSGVPDDRVHVIAPFALSPPDPSIPVPERLRNFAEQHSPFLLSVGGLEPEYDPVFLVEMMKDLLAEYPGAGLMLVGGGSMREQVTHAVEESGTAPSVCLAGDVPHAETLHLIARADAMMRITLFDGDAISVREALFMGTPVVATQNGMRPEGVNCVDPGDRSACVRVLRALLSQPRERPRLLNPDHRNIDEILSLYDSLV